MALPGSGAISTDDLRTEFGLPASFNFPNDCYRGGTYVPNTPTNAGVPVSGALLLPNHFYGASGNKIYLPPTANVSDISARAATSSISYESDGDVAEITSLSGTWDVGDWAFPKTIAPGSYEIRATAISGSVSSGTMNTWLPLTTTRTWSRSRLTVGWISCTILIEIRLGGTILASSTVTLEAERYSDGGGA